MALMYEQASFVALNIEPEEDSEDEIDDSKEIQVPIKRGYVFVLKEKSNLFLDRRSFEAVSNRIKIPISGARLFQ